MAIVEDGCASSFKMGTLQSCSSVIAAETSLVFVAPNVLLMMLMPMSPSGKSIFNASVARAST